MTDALSSAAPAAPAPVVEIFADGACLGNPGPGGWACLLRWRGVEKALSGGEADSTNNRMELMGVIVALESLKRPAKVKVTLDSRYVLDGVTKWIHGWIKNGWKTADKKPVKNQELWIRLHAAAKPHKIDWSWVKGHAGHPENERVDKLARAAAEAAACGETSHVVAE